MTLRETEETQRIIMMHQWELKPNAAMWEKQAHKGSHMESTTEKWTHSITELERWVISIVVHWTVTYVVHFEPANIKIMYRRYTRTGAYICMCDKFIETLLLAWKYYVTDKMWV